MNKLTNYIIGLVVTAVVAIVIALQFAHKLENQNLAVVQSMTGEVVIRRVAGWWLQVCPTITEYAKAGIYQLNSRDRDSLEIQFNNKSKATMNVAIGYRIDTSDDAMLIALHQQVEGNDEKIWKMVLTALNTVAQSITTKYDPSMVIGGDKFEPMIKEMYVAIMHNKELQMHGIDINYFAVDGRPIPDKATEEQFNKQREADLSRRLAEAEKLKLEAEKIKVEAEYAKKMSEQEGIAKAQMAKEVQEQERLKKLAEIAAEQKVSVEKLEKEQMLVKASRELEVANIQKQTEEKNLEIIKIKADQKIADAQARSKELELSKALSETDRAKIELELGKERVKWESIGTALSNMKLPQIVNFGTNGTSNQNPLDNLINMMTIEKLNSTSVKQNSVQK